MSTVGHQKALGFPVDHQIPDVLLGKAAVSILKPIRWYIYARFHFPVETSTRMLSVMQNVVTRTKEQVVTVHDLRPMFFPDNPLQGVYWKYILPYTLKKTKSIITVSETSKQKICAAFRIDAQKVHVVHNAFEPKARDNGRCEKKPRLLCVGCNWKHKNIHELLQNHALWAERYELDVVAADTKYVRSLKEMAQNYGISSRVHFHSDVSDSQLESMYRSAKALVYPSIDEGFGIPPLEAMSFGTPVIASNIPVFREIFGDAPIFIEIGDNQSWAGAFKTLENSEAYEARVQAGSEVVSRYPRSRTFQELNDALAKIWPD